MELLACIHNEGVCPVVAMDTNVTVEANSNMTTKSAVFPANDPSSSLRQNLYLVDCKSRTTHFRLTGFVGIMYMSNNVTA